MTPRAPTPKSFPRTGKKRSKNAAGQPRRDVLSLPPVHSISKWRIAHTNLGQDEHDGLEDDEDPVQDSPESSARLVRNGAVPR